MASEEFRPRKNTLSVTLTESVVFLRAVDLSTRRSAAHENAPPSMLRGLLVLNLVKPTHISSIQVELVGQSVTTWSGARQVEMRDENKLFSATQTFFRAYRSSTNRRTLPVDHEPGLSDSDENDFTNRRLPPHRPRHVTGVLLNHLIPQICLEAENGNALTLPNNPALFVTCITRGGCFYASSGTAESSLSCRGIGYTLTIPTQASLAYRDTYELSDGLSLPESIILTYAFWPNGADIPLNTCSVDIEPPTIPRPLPSSRPTSRTPSLSHLPLSTTSGLRRLHHHDISSPSSRRVSFDEDREYSPLRSRSQSRGRKRSRFSLTSVSSLILEAMRNVSGTSRERVNSRCREQNGDDVHSPHPHHLSGKVGEAVVLDDNIYKDSGEGWCEFQKGSVSILAS
ncbi:hypothetical protein B0F90DRAFT_1816544 [Multifurca ochricompacta]|uniref:Uncharacterized protein n=1 Tax=Multifurca ochricompacta TaxID=376703 RepID=A0AAD4M5R7_9AGAM|nr:hypothetical protein B0F90DRAFT_1816544 [Multifurca ochricompacta]